jgi:hypothetical protein
MFIRFSNQEDPEVYQPTATNTAGTFRLDNGTRIVGAIKNKDYLLVLTDTACYSITICRTSLCIFFRQVGIDCGLIGQHAITTANGSCIGWVMKVDFLYLMEPLNLTLFSRRLCI